MAKKATAGHVKAGNADKTKPKDKGKAKAKAKVTKAGKAGKNGKKGSVSSPDGKAAATTSASATMPHDDVLGGLIR